MPQSMLGRTAHFQNDHQFVTGGEFRIEFGQMPKGLAPSRVSSAEFHHYVKRLRDHAARLDILIRTVANSTWVVRPPSKKGNPAVTLYRDIRVGLRRDYDAGDRPKLSKAETLSQHALYGAFVELRAGHGVPSQMLSEAQRARRVIAVAMTELEGL